MVGNREYEKSEENEVSLKQVGIGALVSLALGAAIAYGYIIGYNHERKEYNMTNPDYPAYQAPNFNQQELREFENKMRSGDIIQV
jgi:hypothetical protein